jgi:hypothetical protein
MATHNRRFKSIIICLGSNGKQMERLMHFARQMTVLCAGDQAHSCMAGATAGEKAGLCTLERNGIRLEYLTVCSVEHFAAYDLRLSIDLN